jgi:hypothetical protein
MGWVKKIPYVEPHKCRPPYWEDYRLEYDVGSRWLCDDCDRLYEFKRQRTAISEYCWVEIPNLAKMIEEGVDYSGTLTPKRKRWYNKR